MDVNSNWSSAPKMTRMSPHGEAPPMSNPLRDDPIAMARAQWVEHGWDDAADGMAAIT